MKKQISLLILLILTLSFISAHNTIYLDNYKHTNQLIIIEKSWDDFDYIKTTKFYKNPRQTTIRKIRFIGDEWYQPLRKYKYKKQRYYEDDEDKDSYYKYNPIKREYKKINCYHEPPKDAIFYRSCPN